VHCSGLFLPRDAAEKSWSFLPGTGFQKVNAISVLMFGTWLFSALAD